MGINGSLEPVVGARGRFWDGSSNEPRCILSLWNLLIMDILMAITVLYRPSSTSSQPQRLNFVKPTTSYPVIHFRFLCQRREHALASVLAHTIDTNPAAIIDLTAPEVRELVLWGVLRYTREKLDDGQPTRVAGWLIKCLTGRIL
jgi:hypothetical protein